jgi:hypothetical protein
MEPWIWSVIVGVPIVAVGAAYVMGAFSTDIPMVNAQIADAQAFQGDTYGGRRRKTKKSKSGHKKTKRRS